MENAGEPDFPVVAFLSISFTHHTAILSQVKSYEERKFYIQFAADYKVKILDFFCLHNVTIYMLTKFLWARVRILFETAKLFQ